VTEANSVPFPGNIERDESDLLSLARGEGKEKKRVQGGFLIVSCGMVNTPQQEKTGKNKSWLL